ncbi:DUF6291 domain-containing protein [Barnesiella sp. An55]|uniref:DUF6291 domain-containing protein n=1 Tax=Barnesiella sp. An55 TaxID=1965646 RepID=UPI000B38D016|nr:DUF6291 domain-containing protein [Barnesiella sp. An55]OUN69502.1 hypothetical protein B5G10_11530 [Barnesiella sp. An55]
MSQDSIVIFRNIIQALDVLPPELYKEVSRLVYAYAFDGIMPPESTEPAALALFLSFKPQIDFNVKRYESYVERGKKGGAPKGNSNARKKAKVESETIQVETTKNNLKQAETTKNNLEQLEEDKEQAETSKNNLISISVSESINNNSVDVVVDNAHAREGENNRKFLDEFFSETHRAQIEVICMQLHTDPDTLRKEAEEVIAEWELTRVTHNDYKEQAQHLINQLRIKYRSKLKDNGRATRTNRESTAAAEDKLSGVCGSTTKKKALRSTI